MSNKNLTNNQLLLKEIISQEYEDNNQFASLDTFFELFSAGQITSVPLKSGRVIN